MIHRAEYAGTFYPEDPEQLATTIDTMINDCQDTERPRTFDKRKLKAIIVPHAGYIYSGPTAAYAYSLLQNYKFNKAIVIGPSHRHPFYGLAFAEYNEWETPMGILPVTNAPWLQPETGIFELNNRVLSSEHSVEVQLPFLQKVPSIESWLPLVTGKIRNYQVTAETINQNLDNETILIISSDLSHFLPYDDCQSVDKDTIQQILKLSPLSSGEQACGNTPIEILRELAIENKWEAELLQYQNSGDTAGDKESVVGYASLAFYQGDD